MTDLPRNAVGKVIKPELLKKLGLEASAAYFDLVGLDRVLEEVRDEDAAALRVVADVGRRLLVREHLLERAAELSPCRSPTPPSS